MAVRDAKTWEGWVMESKGIKKQTENGLQLQQKGENKKMVERWRQRKTGENGDGCKNSGRLETSEEEENTKWVKHGSEEAGEQGKYVNGGKDREESKHLNETWKTGKKSTDKRERN